MAELTFRSVNRSSGGSSDCWLVQKLLKLLCSANRITAVRWAKGTQCRVLCLAFQGTASTVGRSGGVSVHFSNYFLLMETELFYQITAEYYTCC